MFSDTNAGIVAGPGYDEDLTLKVFSGEVLKTFNREVVMKSRVRVRNLTSGVSAQFPAIGKASGGYHKPGQVILGQAIENGEKTINIDDLLLSSVFMSNWEEAVNHYETRSEYTYQMGQFLSQAYDQHLFAVATKACNAGEAGAVAGMGAATAATLTAAPTLTEVIDAIYAGAAHFDSTNIPKNDRCVVVTPELYWDMVRDGSLLDRDFSNGNGDLAKGTLMKVAGFEIIPSNNFALDFGSDTVQRQFNGTTSTAYDYDNTKGLALIFQKQALGSVHLMSVATEREYQINRQGSLVVSKMSVGHGVLRPECMRLIRKA